MFKLFKQSHLLEISSKFTKICRHISQSKEPIITVVGSGPAGFSIAQYLLKNHDHLRINMIEKAPIPYGLIRYGVSPDHQDVKNCIHGYERVAENPRFSFYGNVDVGNQVTLDEVQQVSDAVVLCTGAQKLLRLGIPGEDFSNVFSAKEFVGWYNGVPEYNQLQLDLKGQTAAIVGVGNVALDCARMLLKPHELLKDTDITEESYEALKKSNIKNVILIGRRGPLQMACTRRELSEITELEDVATIVDETCFTEEVKVSLKVKNLKRRKTQRLVKHLMSSMRSSNSLTKSNIDKQFTVKLLRSPVEIFDKNGTAGGIILKKNIMSGEDAFHPEIIPTNEIEKIHCDLIITAIGYDNEAIDNSIPFCKGKISTDLGRIVHKFPLYACGWCKDGPKGVLADTLNDCLVTGNTLINDLKENKISYINKQNNLINLLDQKGIKTFTWDDWKTINKYEIDIGEKLGKVREKVIYPAKMFKVAFGDTNSIS